MTNIEYPSRGIGPLNEGAQPQEMKRVCPQQRAVGGAAEDVGSRSGPVKHLAGIGLGHAPLPQLFHFHPGQIDAFPDVCRQIASDLQGIVTGTANDAEYAGGMTIVQQQEIDQVLRGDVTIQPQELVAGSGDQQGHR